METAPPPMQLVEMPPKECLHRQLIGCVFVVPMTMMGPRGSMSMMGEAIFSSKGGLNAFNGRYQCSECGKTLLIAHMIEL